MRNTDKSKRAFFTKAAAAVGFVAAADHVANLISEHSDSIAEINNNSAHDANARTTLLQKKKMTLMTDDEKQQMLDEILNFHDKNHA